MWVIYSICNSIICTYNSMKHTACSWECFSGCYIHSTDVQLEWASQIISITKLLMHKRAVCHRKNLALNLWSALSLLLASKCFGTGVVIYSKTNHWNNLMSPKYEQIKHIFLFFFRPAFTAFRLYRFCICYFIVWHIGNSATHDSIFTLLQASAVHENGNNQLSSMGWIQYSKVTF